tara:strand:- start:681 stop:1178 length:498 start_codon:yes stop_codon:yes gene_type:complete
MANRVLIGNRSTGGYGLYVSKDGDDVATTTNSLQFDSRMAASAVVQSQAQGTISGNSTADITHNLGYNPLFAVRWNYAADLSSGKATKVYSPCLTESTVSEIPQGEQETLDYEMNFGVSTAHLNTNTIRITNEHSVGGEFTFTPPTIYYAIVIFHQADFTGGLGL